MSEWIKDRNPDKDGQYLCIIGVRGVYYSQVLLSFAKDLYKIDDYAFAKHKKKKDRSGWYDYDTVWGYHEWEVFAWRELPEMPEEFRKEKTDDE
jgi:hypothetical protein